MQKLVGKVKNEILKADRTGEHALIFQRRSRWRASFLSHIPGVGPMTPKFELGLDFLPVHLATKFHNPMFNRSEVIVLTNKHTKILLKTATSFRCATPVENNKTKLS